MQNDFQTAASVLAVVLIWVVAGMLTPAKWICERYERTGGRTPPAFVITAISAIVITASMYMIAILPNPGCFLTLVLLGSFVFLPLGVIIFSFFDKTPPFIPNEPGEDDSEGNV